MTVNQSDPPISKIDYLDIEKSPEFVKLKNRHHNFVLPVAAGFLVWYFAFVLTGAFAPDFMAIKIAGNVNVGIILGLGQFVTTFAITMTYVSFANRRLDPLGADLRTHLEGQDAQ